MVWFISNKFFYKSPDNNQSLIFIRIFETEIQRYPVMGIEFLILNGERFLELTKLPQSFTLPDE
ncbi:MAG: hypothetical protein JWM28_3833 [Chitinophagaceae bacterium]|nr:hypothetical protein [Chitinophagaceae bacterium]